MPEFSISVDLGHIMAEGTPITADLFPNLAMAVQAVADRAEARWKAYAAGAAMPNGKSVGIRSGQYMRSIMQRSLGDFSKEVYSNLPYARVIEEGAPRRDLKELLRSSSKVRISAAGHRYLIIPFRFGSPGNVMRDSPMPDSVRDWWIDKKSSSITGQFLRVSGTGAISIKTRKPLTVAARTYSWGDRLSREALTELGMSDAQTKRMQGMVNFRRPSQSGGAAHSKYLTFRIMSERSPASSWISPAQEGKWPARTTADEFRGVADKVFRAAVEADIKAALPGTST